jgi:8-oxo-dGTP pyrophosphatase MutT (NUDIX family)
MSFPGRAKAFLASIIFRQRLLNRWAHMTLPTKRLSACVMLFDQAGRLLILETTYRQDWLLPGGVVEADEPPWLGARREVREEIGLELGTLHFAAMDWRSSDKEYDDSLHFVFDGGVLTPDQQAMINPDGVEISGYRFVERDEAELLVEPYLKKRILPCWDRRATPGRALILNRGQPDDQAI